MARLFGRDAIANELREFVVSSAAAEHRAGVPLDCREEAVAHLPFRGDSEAVAIFADRLGDRIDKAHAAAAVGESIIGGGLAGIGPRRRLERTDRLFDQAADFVTFEN